MVVFRECNRFHFGCIGKNGKVQMLDRRQILLGVGALMGGSLLPSTARALSAGLSGGSMAAGATVLTAGQMAVVTVMADIIIPETETPGAIGARVPAFVDHALANWLAHEETAAFQAGLDDFTATYPGFAAASRQKQMALVQSIDSQLDTLPPEARFYRQLKELVLIGYYTSEIGAAEELAFDPVPSGYTVVPVTEETKAWST